MFGGDTQPPHPSSNDEPRPAIPVGASSHPAPPTERGDVPDEELIRRCREQDRHAQHALYDRHAPRLHRLALRMMGNPQDADDVIQDAFVQAFSHIDRFRGGSSVATWLHRITVNEALQRLRRHRRSEEKLRALPARSDVPDPADRTDLRLDLDAALARLDPDERAILLLRGQQGLSYAEIADVLSLAPGTVASRLNRARARLRQHLGDVP